ncbi:MAG: hypothetical protein IRY99_27065, partial [Isosphaeraceae bacterium]|nr:hypothetical protein [Isosphaeraceae bacterium]
MRAAILLMLMATTPAATSGDDLIRKALARGSYPWYDAPADAAKPVNPPPR